MDQRIAATAAREALFAANPAILAAPPFAKAPRWAMTSRPYLRAIVYNDYGLEDPVMCVLYALNNLHNWRGPIARKVKQELNEAIKCE